MASVDQAVEFIAEAGICAVAVAKKGVGDVGFGCVRWARSGAAAFWLTRGRFTGLRCEAWWVVLVGKSTSNEGPPYANSRQERDNSRSPRRLRKSGGF